MNRLNLIIAFVILLANLAGAQDLIDGKTIKKQINDWTAEQGIHVEAMIDDKRKFHACEVTPSIQPKVKDDFRTLAYVCGSQETPWKIFIRTKKTSLAEKETTSRLIVVASVPIKKDTVLTMDHVSLVSVPGKLNNQTFNDIADVIGRKALRTIYAEQVIKVQHVSKVWHVEKDQAVMLTNQIGNISVETTGRALENGQINDIISVENLSSGKIISGIVLNRKKIRVLAKMN